MAKTVENLRHRPGKRTMRRVSRGSGVVILLVTTCLCACNNDPPPVKKATTPPPVVYTVPDSKCPAGWKGLTVEPQTAAEIDYLDDIPACSTPGLNHTYLENGSEAVWVVKSPATQWKANAIEKTWQQVLFDEAIGPVLEPNTLALAPGAKFDIALPPSQVQWNLSSHLTLAWHGEDLGIDKLQSLGGAAAVEVARRRSPERAAVAACTLAVAETVKATGETDKEAKSTDLLLAGLGVSVAGGKCHTESIKVRYQNSAGQVETLSAELASVKEQTNLLEKVHTQFGYAVRGEKLMTAFKVCNFVPFC